MLYSIKSGGLGFFPLKRSKETKSQWLPLLSCLRSFTVFVKFCGFLLFVFFFFSPAAVSEYLVFSHIIQCSSSEESKTPLSKSSFLKVQFNTCLEWLEQYHPFTFAQQLWIVSGKNVYE